MAKRATRPTRSKRTTRRAEPYHVIAARQLRALRRQITVLRQENARLRSRDTVIRLVDAVAVVRQARADVAAGGAHDCGEWVQNGRCELCDQDRASGNKPRGD